MSSWTVEGHFRKGEDNEDDLVEVVEPVMLSQEQLDDIRGNLRIYDNRVCERDVVSLLRHIAALEAEFAVCRDEVERWQQLARAQSQAIQAAKAECERLRVFERAMESMAAQMIHPKMTALEMANMQLEEPTP